VSEIKRGDLVRVTTECAYQGLTGQVVWVELASEWPYQVFFESETSGWFRMGEVESIEADAALVVGSDNPEGWEDSWDRQRAAEHDPRNCDACDDHADATTQADRDDRIGGGR
jgi:hypothetical protein